jgi:hypothetical protein
MDALHTAERRQRKARREGWRGARNAGGRRPAGEAAQPRAQRHGQQPTEEGKRGAERGTGTIPKFARARVTSAFPGSFTVAIEDPTEAWRQMAQGRNGKRAAVCGLFAPRSRFPPERRGRCRRGAQEIYRVAAWPPQP